MFSQWQHRYSYSPLHHQSAAASTRALDGQGHKHRFIWLANLMLFIVSLGILFSAYTLQNRNSQVVEAAEKHSPFFLRDLYKASQNIVFHGNFDAPSEYRGQPNSSLDEAWERITNVGVVNISKDYILGTGRSLNSVAFPDEIGGGYLGTVEVIHELHCLDLIRKHSYLDYYIKQDSQFYGAAEFRHHVDHCIEMLRQFLMCQSDLGIITYNWVEGYSTPRPDFNTRHQCRDFEKVLRRVKENQVMIQGKKSRNDLALLQKPKDAFELPDAP